MENCRGVSIPPVKWHLVLLSVPGGRLCGQRSFLGNTVKKIIGCFKSDNCEINPVDIPCEILMTATLINDLKVLAK